MRVLFQSRDVISLNFSAETEEVAKIKRIQFYISNLCNIISANAKSKCSTSNEATYPSGRNTRTNAESITSNFKHIQRKLLETVSAVSNGKPQYYVKP